MIRSRLRFKALGLCAMVLGLMAFSASAAQAEAGGKARWWVNGATVDASGLKPTVEIKELEGGTATLHSKIAGALVEYLCTSAKLTGTKLENVGSLTSGGKVLFHGCVTLLNGVLSPVCTPEQPEQPKGLILSDEGKGLLELHETAGKVKEDVVKISPVRADLRFGIIYHGEECSLPEEVPVYGHLVLVDPVDKGLTEEGAHGGAPHLYDHLITEHSLTKLWVISNTLEHKAVIKGSAWVNLGGEHSAMGWKGVPG